MNLKTRVQEIVAENIETDEEVKLESDLREDLGVDSLGTLILVDALEDEFSLQINPDDFREVETVADIVKRLEEEGVDSD